MTRVRRRMWRRCRHDDEQGSAAVEAVILVPALGLFVGLLVFAGRTAGAHQGVEAVAADAARAASIARSASESQANAADAIAYSLANNGLRCASSSVSVDTAGLSAAVGTPSTVSATVTCTIDLADLSVPGVPGSHTVTATMISPVDAWRQR